MEVLHSNRESFPTRKFCRIRYHVAQYLSRQIIPIHVKFIDETLHSTYVLLIIQVAKPLTGLPCYIKFPVLKNYNTIV